MNAGEAVGALHNRRQAPSCRGQVEAALVQAAMPSCDAVFLERFDALALAAADEQDNCASRPGHGARLISIKGNIDVAGHVTTAGSLALANRPAADASAAVVTQLLAKGYIPIGHTNMTELAFSGLGLNPHHGTPANPLPDCDGRIPGGSSSGAAVSVARGIVDAAIGTDTGGSIRIPAAFCGLTGFKPTASAVSTSGVIPLSSTLDSVGVIAPDVAGCRDVFSAMRGPSIGPISKLGPVSEGIRLGLVQDYVLEGLDADVAAAYDRALGQLVDAGVRIEPCRFPELDQIPPMLAKATFPAFESFECFAGLLETRGAMLDPLVRARIEAGGKMMRSDYVALQRERKWFVDAFAKCCRGFDALIMPTVPIAPPMISSARDPHQFSQLNALVLRNPMTVNLGDGCAIALPCHAPGSLPASLSLIQRNGFDDQLLQIALEIERLLVFAGLRTP